MLFQKVSEGAYQVYLLACRLYLLSWKLYLLACRLCLMAARLCLLAWWHYMLAFWHCLLARRLFLLTIRLWLLIERHFYLRVRQYIRKAWLINAKLLYNLIIWNIRIRKYRCAWSKTTHFFNFIRRYYFNNINKNRYYYSFLICFRIVKVNFTSINLKLSE